MNLDFILFTLYIPKLVFHIIWSIMIIISTIVFCILFKKINKEISDYQKTGGGIRFLMRYLLDTRNSLVMTQIVFYLVQFVNLIYFFNTPITKDSPQYSGSVITSLTTTDYGKKQYWLLYLLLIISGFTSKIAFNAHFKTLNLEFRADKKSFLYNVSSYVVYLYIFMFLWSVFISIARRF